jgi:heterogeneous nuclear ribonucleoprotein A1/A3
MRLLLRSPRRRLGAVLAFGIMLVLATAMPAAAQSGYPYPPSKGSAWYGYGSPCYFYAGIGYGPFDPYRTPCTPYGYTVTGSSLSYPSFYPYFGGYGYGHPYYGGYGFDPYSAYYGAYLGGYYGAYYGSLARAGYGAYRGYNPFMSYGGYGFMGGYGGFGDPYRMGHWGPYGGGRCSSYSGSNFSC